MKFQGYVIANDTEEFLNSFEHTSAYEIKTWTIFPGSAQVFLSLIDARRMLSRLRKDPGQGGQCWVLELYDTGSHWVVSTQKTKRPKWLDPDVRRDLTDGHTSAFI